MDRWELRLIYSSMPKNTISNCGVSWEGEGVIPIHETKKRKEEKGEKEGENGKRKKKEEKRMKKKDLRRKQREKRKKLEKKRIIHWEKIVKK